MKKLLCMIVISVISLSLTGCKNQADDILRSKVEELESKVNKLGEELLELKDNDESGNYYTVDLEDGTLEIIKYDGNESVVEVPKEIDGKIVTQIGDHAFANLTMDEVTFPDTIREIGANVFSITPTIRKLTLLSKDAVYLESLAIGRRQGEAETNYFKLYVKEEAYETYKRMTEIANSQEISPFDRPELFKKYGGVWTHYFDLMEIID